MKPTTTAAAPVTDPRFTAAALAGALDACADPVRAAHSQRYFRTGPGEYGEGDVFLGVPVPLTRSIVKAHRGLPVTEASRLLASPVHEHRLAALLSLVATAELAARRGEHALGQEVHEAYLSALRAGRVNGWDLVDTSAERLAGDHWRNGRPSTGDIDALALSPQLWERRTAVVSTFSWIKAGQAEPTLRIATLVLGDREDLLHKASGWMLREVGRRISPDILTAYLDVNAGAMPRTMLSYAIEQLDPTQKAHYRAVPRR